MAIDRHETAYLFGGTALSAALHAAALAALLGLGAGTEIPAEPLSMVVEVVVSTQTDADEGMAGNQSVAKPSSADTASLPKTEIAPPTETPAADPSAAIAEPPEPIEAAMPPATPPQAVQSTLPPPRPMKPVQAAPAAPPAPKQAHAAIKPTPPAAPTKRMDSPPAESAEPAPAAVAPDTQTMPPTQQASVDRSGAMPVTVPNIAPRAGEGADSGAHSSAAALVANPAPAYPPVARRRGLEGKVVLRVAVTAAGATADIAVLSSSGHAMLDDAAARAVRAWRFRPAQRSGVAIDSILEVPIVFRLVTDSAPTTTSRAGAAE